MQENLTIGEAAACLGMTRGALQQRLNRGSFPIEPIRYADGGHRYFNKAAIEALATGGLSALETLLAGNSAEQKGH
ncbi:helix-turn-helix domain-containing protein [Pseudarthrobacter phenanthrenivorans]|uniref:helix-turn-helix domain-containing protein n=1 Tax=Pseudarthrobacter phenanthrenivorans TaxID=361575 RepID=UPI00142FA96E|nr:helix-turn-helix domain-containing protein [Pseudarthrobacter phenanthrenivorans]